jgi:ferric-dicitrate binding protein FerR (iron transport regulator)
MKPGEKAEHKEAIDEIDPYLWDRSGVPDPEVLRLEELLTPFRAKKTALRDSSWSSSSSASRERERRPRKVEIALGVVCAVALAAAIVALLRSKTTWPMAPPTPTVAPVATNDLPAPKPSGSSCAEQTAGSWAFHTEGGPTRCGNSAIVGNGWVRNNDVLETTASSKATLDVSTLGTLGLEPNTRLRLLKAEGDVQKLDLLRGTVHANISAPPRIFVVKTPLADAVDLGCEYTLTVDDETGKGVLHVEYGAVSLERESRAPTLVVQGTSCAIGPRGPGTPLSKSASETLRRAATDLDGGDGSAFDRIVAASTKSDTITLWHMMRRISPDERGRAFDKLSTFVRAPKGAPRDAIVRGEKEAFAAYRAVFSEIWFAEGTREPSRFPQRKSRPGGAGGGGKEGNDESPGKGKGR